MRASGLATVFIALCAGCAAPPPQVPQLPSPQDVEKVTVTVFGSISDQPDLPEFEVPSAFVPDVLRILGPAEHHKRPPTRPDDVVGLLRVACRDGRVCEVRVLYTRGETVLFDVGGVPCRRVGKYSDMDPATGVYRPEAMGIEAFLRAVQRGKAGQARAALERLDRCAGRSR